MLLFLPHLTEAKNKEFISIILLFTHPICCVRWYKIVLLFYVETLGLRFMYFFFYRSLIKHV